MRCGKTDALYFGHFSHLPDQFREAWLTLGLQSVGIDVLSQQHDLPDPFIGQLSDFSQDIRRTAADLPSPDVRNDTVGAEVVTPLHHGNKTGEAGFRPDRRKQVQALVIVDKRCFRTALSLFGPPDHIRQQVQIMGSENQIQVGKLVQQLFPLLLGHATTDGDNLRLPVALVDAKVLETLVDLLLGAAPDAAGIQHDHIGDGRIVGRNVPQI